MCCCGVSQEHVALRIAAALSKWEDKTDRRFSKRMAQEELFLQMGTPEVDCLACAQAHMCTLKCTMGSV